MNVLYIIINKIIFYYNTFFKYYKNYNNLYNYNILNHDHLLDNLLIYNFIYLLKTYPKINPNNVIEDTIFSFFDLYEIS